VREVRVEGGGETEEMKECSVLLAIDPGHTESAWVLCDGKNPLAFAKEKNELLLDRIRRQMWPVVMPDHAVIEQIKSYGMSVGAEIFETCVWTGRFMEACGPGTVDRIPRLDVKLNLCHDSRAKDQNVRQAIIDRFGGKEKAIGKKAAPGPLYGVSSDVWAALAVALTWWDQKTIGAR
jgi:hypothetical protein